MARGRTCGYEGCRNPIKEGDIRCHLHVGKTQTIEGNDIVTFDIPLIEAEQRKVRAFRRNKKLRKSLLNPPATLGKQGEVYARDTAYEGIGVSPQTVSSIFEATNSLGPLETREDLLKSMENGGIEKFHNALKRELGEDRVKFIQFSGLTISTTKRDVNVRDYAYAASVIDYGEETEVVVDPFSRALLPSKLEKDRKQEVILGLDSPFRDQVFIGTLSEYSEGAIQWENVEIGSIRS